MARLAGRPANGLGIFVAFVFFVVPVFALAQGDVADSQLIAASAGRVVRIGPPSGSTGRITSVPLEVYVARVLAGEGEPNAADAARQALAVAIRTYALANAARHGRDGFDVCDSTHCQVLRISTLATRRAALATAGRILTYNNSPAQLFYSASCGGYSESADQVWPGAEYPYLRVAADDVHQDDPPWTLTLTLEEVGRALTRAGFAGRLRGIRIEERNASGRASRLELAGLTPGSIAGDQFRAAVGFVTVRSTAFSIETSGNVVRFTGRGFGHGVGMCVIGAGRRAARGESMEAILAQYYPGLELAAVNGTLRASDPAESAAESVKVSRAAQSTILVQRVPATAKVTARHSRNQTCRAVTSGQRWHERDTNALVIICQENKLQRVSVTANDIERLALSAHADLAKVLGVSIAPVTVRIHESLESFRAATGRPWWISSVADGTEIELVPVALLAQRDGVETTLRRSMAELFVAQTLRGRAAWVHIGAARFFARGPTPTTTSQDRTRIVYCPADAELTLAVSATLQREAEARAEACFAREYAKRHDWRAIR